MIRRVGLALWLAACSDAGSGDPTTPAATGEPPICDEAPITTWDNFGAGFVTQHCQACHASTSLHRHGAPAEVTFDDEEQVWTWADRILVRSAGDDADMPPQGGVHADDRYRLEVWLTCGG